MSGDAQVAAADLDEERIALCSPHGCDMANGPDQQTDEPEAQAERLRIPDDVAVVGSDGLPRSRSLLIGLTTIVQPVKEMAERSFELLLDQITRPRGTYKHSVCAHRLHIGRTCGCPPDTGAR